MIGFSEYEQIKVKAIQGRYLPPAPVYNFLKTTLDANGLEVAGRSVEDREIFAVKLGSGPNRVLAWSQMHGNESTTTKALLDFIQACQLNPPRWLEGVELLLIPVLNPDGARAYTRFNANKIDLNRDAQKLSQPESLVLRRLFDSFKPHYCLNLHDQRTIYGAGTPPRSATLSFLAPAADPERGFSASRRRAAGLIGMIVESAQSEIGIGRYDDTFNLDCVGDSSRLQGFRRFWWKQGIIPGTMSGRSPGFMCTEPFAKP